MINNNPKVKAAVIAFLSELGTGIKDIAVSIDKKKLESSELPPFLSDEFKAFLLQDKVDAITAKVNYGKFETDLMEEESTGIKKLIAAVPDVHVRGFVVKPHPVHPVPARPGRPGPVVALIQHRD